MELNTVTADAKIQMKFENKGVALLTVCWLSFLMFANLWTLIAVIFAGSSTMLHPRFSPF